MNQALLRSKTIRTNLSEVAHFLNTLNGDVIGLQEAVAWSRWSGRFDHVALLSSQTAKPCVVHGTHARGRWYNFGTALLSAQPFLSAVAHDFAPSRPTTTKGFVLGTLQWNPDNLLTEPFVIRSLFSTPGLFS